MNRLSHISSTARQTSTSSLSDGFGFVPNLGKVTQTLSDRINATYMVNLLRFLAWLQINLCV